MQKQIEKLVSDYRDDLKKHFSECFPTTLLKQTMYNYTSIRNLSRIIKNKYLTYTHFDDLNDPMEIRYAAQIIEECIQSGTASRDLKYMWDKFLTVFKCNFDPEVLKLERNNFQSIESIETNVYTFSLCEAADDLPMWRFYGDNGAGVSIGFRPQYFPKQVKAGQFPTYTDICYGEEAFDKIKKFLSSAISSLEDKIKSFKESCDTNNINEEQSYPFANQLRLDLQSDLSSYLLLLLPAIKHPGYKLEKEHRLYYLEHKILKKDEKIHPASRLLDDAHKFTTPVPPREKDDNRLIVNNKGYARRYQSEPFDWSDIAEIWIGPRLDFQFTRLQILNMLKEGGYDTSLIDTDCGIHIKKSKMPYQ